MRNGKGLALPVALLLLLLPLLVNSLGPGPDPCRINQVRTCGYCPSSNTTTLPMFGETARIISFNKNLRGVHHESMLTATFTDVVRLPDSYLLLMEMPGVANWAVQVELLPGTRVLSIRGMSLEAEEPRVRLHRGALNKLFARKFVLPSNVIDPEAISHQIRDGLLRITLPVDPSSSPDEHWMVDKREVLPPDYFRGEWMDCRAEDVNLGVRPEALLPAGNLLRCGEEQSCEKNVIPLADVVEREDSYVVVYEMPGVEAGKVRVGAECPAEWAGCYVSVAGVVEAEEDEWGGEVLRVERGGGRRKLFTGALFFTRDDITPRGMSYELADGLLRVKLLRPGPEDHQQQGS